MSPSAISPSVRRLALVALALSSTLARAEGERASTPHPALLDVTVNGVASPEPILLLTDDQGGIHASAATFAAWRLRVPEEPGFEFDGVIYYPLAAVGGLTQVLNEPAQSVVLEAEPQAFTAQLSSLAGNTEMPMTDPGTGLFLGYDLLAEHVGGNSNAAGTIDLGLFTRHGTGNLTLVGAVGAGPDHLTRLDTGWTIDGPTGLTTIQLGDAVSTVGPGGVPMRFGGVRYSRNFALRPGFLTMPLPVASGDAALPSVVDIYVNNSLQASRRVAPGPFELSNIPVQTGGGIVQIVVRDMLGRQIVIDQPYYASTQLLRRGLHDFSYEAGFLRRDFGRKSFDYGTFMVATTHRYGLTDQLTAEGHFEVTAQRQMAGLALSALHPLLGLGGLSASISQSERGTGFRASASAEHSDSSFSFGTRAEYTDRRFAFVGMPSLQQPPRVTFQAFADTSFRHGSIGANLLFRDRRDGANESLAGAVASLRVNGAAALQFYARRSLAGRPQTQVGLHFAIILGERRSLSANAQSEDGRATGSLSFQQDAPDGIGSGFRAGVTVGDFNSADLGYVRNLEHANLGAQLGYARGKAGLRLSAAGAIGMIGRDLFASRRLGSSFASVQLDDYPGVRVYADNQLIGITGHDGRLIVPALRPFETNRIRLDEADLPIEVHLEQSEIALRPFARSGMAIHFTAKRERGVLLRVRLDDGSVLPAGAIIRQLGNESEYVTVTGGEAYIPDLSGTASFTAAWATGRCDFTISVPDNDDPQPLLDNIVCMTGERYATR